MLRRFSYLSALRPPCPPLTGYFANWKMFEPRKLIPLSIELCSAPIAVMTEITEKTPMVMPIMVSPERSLFAPSELSAILMTSLKNIFKNPKIEFNHRGHGEHGVIRQFRQADQEPCDECRV